MFAPKGAVDKAAHCLPVYRIESWHGLVFVSLNSSVEPLNERFAAVEPQVAGQGMDQMRHWSGQQETHVWDCNGESSFIQRVTRHDHPVTYWVVVSTWILLATLWLMYPE